MRVFNIALVLVTSIAFASSVQSFADNSASNGKDKYKNEKQDKQNKQNKKDKYTADDKNDNRQDELAVGLSQAEQNALAALILEEQYGFTKNSVPQGKAKELPPGLAKKLERGGSLPPGWATKLQRGEVIDRETYEQAERLPQELLRRITGRDDAVELLRVGDRILRVSEGRGTILDVIDLTDRALNLLE